MDIQKQIIAIPEQFESYNVFVRRDYLSWTKNSITLNWSNR